MSWYFTVLKKYAVFNGRARRKEYWMFCLFNFIISFVINLIAGMPGDKESIFYLIYQLAIVTPFIAVGIRRMHDVGKSGWFLWIPIYNLILAVRKGDESSNKYGADPKGSV